MLGDNYSIESNKTILLINATPDAVYLRDIDTLFFKQIPAISTIFNGIDVLYREATAREAQAFLQSPFITLQNGFSAQNVSKPNLHRISMAMETLRGLEDTQVQEVVSYIQDYCPALPCSDGQFSIGTDNQLKYLLYGIEQRYYTTVITREKRLANSVISLRT